MRDMQLLHRGRLYSAQVSYEGTDVMEVSCEDPSPMIGGDPVICFDRQKQVQMRVLRVSQSRLILAPADSEIFRIGVPAHEQPDHLYDDDHIVPSFKLNTFGTLIDDFKIQAVRICRISRLGIGFELNDFSVKMNHIFDSMIICDEETIHPKLIVRFAHIGETTIRYGADIHSISANDLKKLRYYILTQKLLSA